jgi:hypothetical protein
VETNEKDDDEGRRDERTISMTRERLIELWPVMEGFKNGHTVQTQNKLTDTWLDTSDPHWLDVSMYRLKPPPFECWLEVNSSGHVLRAFESNTPKTLYNSTCRILHVREVESEVK